MTDYDRDYTRYQLDRGHTRKLVRRLYLESAVRKLRGPTVDFGCGIGELLQQLPEGSIGLEINQASVHHCRSRGLDTRIYDADSDQWALGLLDVEQHLRSLVISHVLEHLDQPMDKLARLLRACAALGIDRVLVIVPGRCGYNSDRTHRTFIDLPMLSNPRVVEGTTFSLTHNQYFPGNLRLLGDIFAHHELQVTFDARPRPELERQ